MVFPSPYEVHTGEVFDPTEHAAEIDEANRVLRGFLADMAANRVPDATLETIQRASVILGLYAGYPADACYMEEFLCSPSAASYRATASVLKEFLEQMNALIEARHAESAKLAADTSNNSARAATDSFVVESDNDDVPF